MLFSIFFFLTNIDFLNNNNSRFKNTLKLNIGIYNKFIIIAIRKKIYIF